MQYRFYGCGNWKASARGNSIKGQQAGSNSILFAKDNAVISWELPPLLLRGGTHLIRLLAHVTTFLDTQIHFNSDTPVSCMSVLLVDMWVLCRDPVGGKVPQVLRSNQI